MNSVHTMLRKAQLRWAGHVVRMPEERLPKQIFYGELTHGKRSLGGQRKRFKDTLKASLKSFSINPETWEVTAADRPTWRSFVTTGATAYETGRNTDAVNK
jgi:hypothetical protein